MQDPSPLQGHARLAPQPGSPAEVPGHIGQQLPSMLMGSTQGSGGQLTVEQRVWPCRQ